MESPGVRTHVNARSCVRRLEEKRARERSTDTLDPHTEALSRARERVTWGEAFFLVRLSRQRFIPRSRKTNGKIVSKILTAHLGEHVLAPRAYPSSCRLGLGVADRPTTGIRDKDKGARDCEERRGWTRQKVFRVGTWAEKKFSSYPFDGNAVPKLVARFVTESSRETRSHGNCRPGTGLSQLLAFDQLSRRFTCPVLHHHLRNVV